MIGVCSGVGGPVWGRPLVGDGGGPEEVGGGLVVPVEEEGEFAERVDGA